MATDKQRGEQWIIRVGAWYLVHPRGEWSKKPDVAYGYHYKGGPSASNTGAEDEASGWRRYIEQMRTSPSTARAPGMLPPTTIPLTASVMVMRRKEAKALPPEAAPPARRPPPGVMDAKPLVARLLDTNEQPCGAVLAKDHDTVGAIIVGQPGLGPLRVFTYSPIGRPSEGYRFVEVTASFLPNLEAAKALLASTERPE